MVVHLSHRKLRFLCSNLLHRSRPDFVGSFSYFFFLTILALVVFTPQSYCHGTGACRPSVRKHRFFGNRTAAWIKAKFYGKVPIHHISRSFFLFFFTFIFYEVFSFSLTWEIKFQNTTSLTVSVRFLPNFHDQYVSHGRI